MTSTIVTPIKSDLLVLKLATQIMGRDNTPLPEIVDRIIDVGSGDIIPNGFFIWDIEHEKISYSPNFQRTIGGCEDNDPQRFMDSMQINELQNFVHIVRKNIAAKNKEAFSLNVKYITDFGESIYLLCVCTVIYLESSTLIICTHYQN